MLIEEVEQDRQVEEAPAHIAIKKNLQRQARVIYDFCGGNEFICCIVYGRKGSSEKRNKSPEVITKFQYSPSNPGAAANVEGRRK